MTHKVLCVCVCEGELFGFGSHYRHVSVSITWVTQRVQLTCDWLTERPVVGDGIDAGADPLGDDITGAVGQALFDWPGVPLLAVAVHTRTRLYAHCGRQTNCLSVVMAKAGWGCAEGAADTSVLSIKYWKDSSGLLEVNCWLV